MKELEMTIRQDSTLFRLDVTCASSATSRIAIKRIFGHYDEVNGIMSVTCKAVSITKLISIQINLICELSENGQI